MTVSCQNKTALMTNKTAVMTKTNSSKDQKQTPVKTHRQLQNILCFATFSKITSLAYSSPQIT
jgi:hypothetical protein